jgi:peptidoglycan/LPS O-acetylase OafA/YrhL
MSKSSLALSNLRGFAILNVVAFHAFIAYLSSNPASPPPFSSPPYEWSGKPVTDTVRWLGFDVYCAFQYLYLMQLMFFLSGLFVWSSLNRKGGRVFLTDRLMRLGLPFVLGVYLLMPLAYFPAYLVTTANPSWPGFWAEWTALPIWPSGPMWFLWFLFALNVAAAGMHALAPRVGDYLGRLAARADEQPRRFFVGFVAISALTYIPLSFIFNPWDWIQSGPFGFQPSFAPQYVQYFVAGLGVGACGLGRGLLADNGTLVRHWRLLLGGTLGGFVLWIIPTALIVEGGSTIPGLQTVADLGFVLSAAAACFGLTAIFLRFGTKPWPVFGPLSDNAYGIYFVHYVFVTWLQYLLLGVALFAIVKAGLVFGVSLGLSWAVSAAIGRIPLAGRLTRATRPAALEPAVIGERTKVSQPVG